MIQQNGFMSQIPCKYSRHTGPLSQIPHKSAENIGLSDFQETPNYLINISHAGV